RLGKAREQDSHAGDVAVVFPRLVGAAQDHVVDRFGRKSRIARNQLTEDVRGEIVRADGGERAGVATNGSAQRVADEGFGHALLSKKLSHRGQGGGRRGHNSRDLCAISVSSVFALSARPIANRPYREITSVSRAASAPGTPRSRAGPPQAPRSPWAR